MEQEKEHFLNLANYPARIRAEQVAWYLGFTPPEIAVLMAEGIFKPLGRPARNGPKYFATAELEDLCRNLKWLAKASDALVCYWQNRNSNKNFTPHGTIRSEKVLTD